MKNVLLSIVAVLFFTACQQVASSDDSTATVIPSQDTLIINLPEGEVFEDFSIATDLNWSKLFIASRDTTGSVHIRNVHSSQMKDLAKMHIKIQ